MAQSNIFELKKMIRIQNRKKKKKKELYNSLYFLFSLNIQLHTLYSCIYCIIKPHKIQNDDDYE